MPGITETAGPTALGGDTLGGRAPRRSYGLPSEVLLRAARRVAATEGVSGTTVDGIAAEAGVGRSTVYRRFPGGRRELIDELVDRELGDLAEGVAHAVAGTGTVTDALVSGITLAARHCSESPVIAHLIGVDRTRVTARYSFDRLGELLSWTADLMAPLLESRADATEVFTTTSCGARSPEGIVDWAARLVASHLLGRGLAAEIDLTDPAVVGDLVVTHLQLPLGDAGPSPAPTANPLTPSSVVPIRPPSPRKRS